MSKVLLIANGDRVTVGTPTIDGAKVIATSQEEGKGKKIIVLKYKPKVRYRKKTGHRQLYTRLFIDKIVEPKAKQGKPTKKVRQRKKEVYGHNHDLPERQSPPPEQRCMPSCYRANRPEQPASVGCIQQLLPARRTAMGTVALPQCHLE